MRSVLGRAPLLCIGAWGLVLNPAAQAQVPSAPPAIPLFASDEVIELRLIADLEALASDRAEENPERPARIVVADVGEAIQVDIRTRGNFRLRRSTCSFPPLRLDFPRKDVVGTVFEGQDKLKLVTHCRDNNDYEQQVIREFLAYRIYNLLTDSSFRVRLAHITYVDELAREDPIRRFGFLIEDEDALALRLGGEVISTPLFDPRDYDAQAALLVSLFQFMIGNTDWSIVEFHNAILLRLAEGRHVPVAYDFDFSGFVDAKYAIVNPTLGIESVKDRLYRGFCGEALPYQEVYSRIAGLGPEILERVRSTEALSGGTRRSVTRYLEDFFAILGSESRRAREIERGCRSVS